MRRLIGTLVVLALAASASAVTYIGFEQVTVANTAIGFTTTKIDPPGRPQAAYAYCRLETAEIRYTYDGTTPTTTVGTLLEPGDGLPLQGHDSMQRFLAIRTGAVSGVLSCTYTAP